MSINAPSFIDRRVLRTKKVLKNSLITLMKQKEFMEITISEIVKVSELNRGTFYKHYLDKQELLDEILDEVIMDLVESYREPYRKVSTFVINELNSSAIKIFEHVARHANFYEMALKSNVLPGFQYRITNELKKVSIHDLVDSKPNSLVNSDLQASYQAYAIFGMIMEWVNEGFKYSPSYMAKQLLEILKMNTINSTYIINKVLT
jgi:AcrR family transcriptional regulator